jgi:CRISPR-associated endonuclease/helicase Cas3
LDAESDPFEFPLATGTTAELRINLETRLEDQFSSDFRKINRHDGKDGPEPLKWQIRMFRQLRANDVPRICDLPTGMGKTSIIHLWALALRHQISENKPRLPTRLIYVVDRRTVVDQATDIAERIQNNLDKLPEIGLPNEWLTVSTLRGQFADNREWTKDPSKPAIVIGTVDMIGSRLLFSGYRSSYKLRPLDAGLIGQDTWLVLDEAHLSAPFEKLVRELSDEGKLQRNQGLPMRVTTMSATTLDNAMGRFRLEQTDLEGDLNTNPIVRRYDSKKRLVLEEPVEKNKLRLCVVKAAAKLAIRDNARVVVFTQKPDDAQEIAQALRRLLSESAVEELTGTMRGLERDELLKHPVLRRLLDGEEKPEDRASRVPAVLVSTSAGEVGFDLNADHMICDAAPLDSMIQRLGRVNRRGYGDANVHVFVAKAEDKQTNTKGKKSKNKNQWETATGEALKYLERLPFNDDGTHEASPRAIDQLRQSLSEEQIQAASAPKPDMVDANDILLDAWSMTTIAGRMPGRPPVAPWLRGLSDDEPQTTITWRAELDVEGFGLLDLDDIEEWLDAHRILPRETLSVPTNKAREWILGRWEKFSPEDRLTAGGNPCIVDRGGLKKFTLKNLVEELDLPNSPIRSADVLLPASFGGIQRGRLLDADSPKVVDSEEATSANLQSISDVADTKRRRCRILREDGVDRALVGTLPENYDGLAWFCLDLPGGDDAPRQLISLVPKPERPESGNTRQSLKTHVNLVERYAAEIAARLSLSEEVFCEALRLAARWHDSGKDREIWQRAVDRKPDETPVGKSGGSMRRISGGYRHEFGSMREFADAHNGKIADEVFDLAIHLISVHHGRGRPHFPKGGFDPNARAASEAIASESVRRFGRLQRRYGYWQLAWLENLLRCADAMASAENVIQP